MNNQSLQIVLTIIGVLGSVGLFAGGVGYLINRFNKGKTEERTDVISSADQLASFWKEQVEGFKAIVAELTTKIEKQKDEHNTEMKKVLTELGEVRGQLTSESKQKAEYLAILQNRDPETQKFMEIMLKFVDTQSKTNTEIARVLKDIHSMAKAEHDSNLEVTSTVTKK